MKTKRIIRECAYLLLGFLLISALSACGEDLSAAPAGVYVDSSTDEFLRTTFYEVKACTGLEAGTYEEISVVIMPPFFPCDYYSDGCSGEYVEPNLVRLGSHYIWRHELIHYFLYENTGNSDAPHESSLFDDCEQPKPGT